MDSYGSSLMFILWPGVPVLASCFWASFIIYWNISTHWQFLGCQDYELTRWPAVLPTLHGLSITV